MIFVSRSEYPTAFVEALQHVGVLSMLIPTEYGGTGSTLGEASVALEEIHASGCNGAAAHAQMYIMGSILRHGADDQKKVSGVGLSFRAVSQRDSSDQKHLLEHAKTTVAVYIT